VTRIDLPDGPVYSLTPSGLGIVGMWQEIDRAVDRFGRVDLTAVARMGMQQHLGVQDAVTQEALRQQAAWPVDDSIRDWAVSALSNAYARGALTKDQFDERTYGALTATSMGARRLAGRGIFVLPPLVTSPSPA
jgi:hypothetical protein